MLTVRDWDAGIAHVLTGQSTYAYERREIGGVVQYIISLGDVELGHFSITPGPEPFITCKTEDAARREPAYNQGLVALWHNITTSIDFRLHLGPWANGPVVKAAAWVPVRGGRRAYEADDWAYEQVASEHRLEETVFHEWKKREDVAARELAKPWKSFREALRTRAKTMAKQRQT